MNLDFLFNRHSRSSLADRREPEAGLPGDRPAFGASHRSPLALPEPYSRNKGRHMSPRQMADWAYEMYMAGSLSWAEYLLAGFPPELHPDYDRTVGALTGQPAEPDRPRDMLREWQEKLAFFHRHNAPIDPQVRRTEKVVALLSSASRSSL